MPPLSVKKSGLPSNVNRAAAEIFSKYGGFIRAVISYKVSDTGLVDDLFQDFYLSLVSRPIPSGIQNIKSYLYMAINNDVIDAARRVEKYRTRMRKYAECSDFSINKDTPENALINKEEINKMFKLIEGRLPHSEAQALKERYIHNLTIKEIAEKMCVKTQTVRRYICEGLSKCRQFLTAKQGE
jgi:RNA polymerase sigma factor (sigma-70 family)